MIIIWMRIINEYDFIRALFTNCKGVLECSISKDLLHIILFTNLPSKKLIDYHFLDKQFKGKYIHKLKFPLDFKHEMCCSCLLASLNNYI